MRKLLYSNVLLVISIFFTFQNVKANSDSLKNEYLKNKDHSIGKELVLEMLSESQESAFSVADELKVNAKRSGNKKHLLEAFDLLGQVYMKDGNYDSAIHYWKEAVNLSDLTQNESSLHEIYNNLGKVYANKGEYGQSIESFREALNLMENEKNAEGQAFYLNNIGIVFDIQGIYDKALDYYQRSLKIKKANKMQDALAASYNNIAIVLFNLNKVEESIRYHQLALDENIRMNKTSSIARSHNNIGFGLISLGKIPEALVHLHQALSIREKEGDQRGVPQTLINIASAHQRADQTDSAKFYAEKGLSVALELGVPSIQKDGHLVLSELHEKKGDFASALKEFRSYSSLMDTLRNEDAYKKIAEADARYNLSIKEREIEKQKFELEKKQFSLESAEQRNKLYISLLIIVLVVLTAIYIRYDQKKKNTLLLKGQLELIRNQNHLLQQLNEGLEGKLQTKEEILEKVFTDSTSDELPPELLALSRREMEVLAYLALGWTDQQIADALFVSKTTIKTHTRRIYSKLLVNNRVGAVAIAHKYNIISRMELPDSKQVA